MITFIILALIIFTALMIGVAVISVGGTLFIVLGADIIVAAFIIWLVYWLIKKRKK